ncbi:DNA-binding response regulator [Kibdelosporangium aridum]|uniref:DNA-binding response regulator n=1 Tax=Kibdelosporangium aridum TaxID=2030 RepID=A0A428XXA2_KIBAR|nr:response regulator transcription factor [Kibdelosporangium aridum]RSM59948.1 DNA-binding response regulator [Kibdelosporangium aridum]
MARIRVLLADDEQLLRAGVRLVLRHAEDIEVAAEAEDGAQAVEMACRLGVDVVLMDIRMPGMDGLAALDQIIAKAPAVHVVMLTTFGEHDYIARALRAGAAGFILKDTGPQELIQAVRAAAHGGAILSPRITREIINEYLNGDEGRTAEARRLVGTLTEREREVLVMIGLGASNADAARRLYMGEGTVKTYVSRILSKLGCANRVQAAIIAHDAGVLPA